MFFFAAILCLSSLSLSVPGAHVVSHEKKKKHDRKSFWTLVNSKYFRVWNICNQYLDCCNLKLKAILCLCTVISVNPSMPASRWYHLLKLQWKKFFNCKVVSWFKATVRFNQKRSRYQPTQRGPLRADRSSIHCFNTNPYKSYIFWKLNNHAYS